MRSLEQVGVLVNVLLLLRIGGADHGSSGDQLGGEKKFFLWKGYGMVSTMHWV